MTTRPHWELPGSSLDQLLSQGLDRLIFACSNRLDYPLAQLEWVQATYPELPCGLAMSSYWDGARRTGLGLLPHIAFPWHRWWDGWVAWLEATSASWFGPCIDARTATHPQPQTIAHSLGRIIANCQQTAHAWRLAAQQAGATVSHFSPSGLDADPVDPGEIDWILWDDSCLSTHTGPHDELAVDSVTAAFPAISARPAGLCVFHAAVGTLEATSASCRARLAVQAKCGQWSTADAGGLASRSASSAFLFCRAWPHIIDLQVCGRNDGSALCSQPSQLGDLNRAWHP